MDYPDVYPKFYSLPRSEEICAKRGRDINQCPAKTIKENLLEPVYGPELRLTGCESSMSLAARPDPIFAILKRRATRQIHIFEKPLPVGGKAESYVGALDVRCPSQQEANDLKGSGKWESVKFCAAGYLRPPSYMTSDKGYAIPLLAPYSVHVGILPFPCTPYMSHHSFFGYVCAQAAVYLCLEMMMPLGAVPHGPAVLSHIVSCIDEKRLRKSLRGAFLCKHHKDLSKRVQTEGYFPGGLDQKDLVDLLGHESLQTKGLSFHVAEMGSDTEKIALDHIETMLCSHIPLIGWVDFDTLAGELGEADYLPPGQPGEHVVTIIGFCKPSGGPAKVVFHDGQMGPYRELEIDSFVRAAHAANNGFEEKRQDMVLFSAFPFDVSPETYKALVSMLSATTREREFTHKTRLSSFGRLAQYLTQHAPGQVTHLDLKALQELYGQVQENDPIWLVEYRAPEAGETYIDIVSAGTLVPEDMRYGVICLGSNPAKEEWKLIQAKDDEQDLAYPFTATVKRARRDKTRKILTIPRF